MRATIELEGSGEQVAAVIQAIVNFGLARTITTIDDGADAPVASTGWVSTSSRDVDVEEKAAPPGAPFEIGQPVVLVRERRAWPDLKYGHAGVVARLGRRGRGWAVEVDWDDDTTSVVQAAMLAPRGWTR